MDRRLFCSRFNRIMRRVVFSLVLWGVTMAVLDCPPVVAAEGGGAPGIGVAGAVVLAAVKGGNAYLSWWKLALVVGAFLFWVRNSDWINQDAVKLADGTDIEPQFWNLINVGTGIAGFFAAISIPIFWLGYPLFLLAALVPMVCYTLVRKKQLSVNQGLRQRVGGGGKRESPPQVLAQDQGVELSFTPAGDTDVIKKGNLIKSRQSAGFVPLKEMLFDAKTKRADIIEINFTQTQAAARLFVDGTWHATEPMDRPSGDALLVSLKQLAGLNPKERRAKQKGGFGFKSEFGKAEVQVQSQGIKTGEMVQVKFVGANRDLLNLKELGMFPSMADRLVAGLNSPGVVIVSSPPRQGLSSTWQGVLVSADRLTRDCIGLVPAGEKETSIENVAAKPYQDDQDAATVLKAALLAQPDAIAVPELTGSVVLDMLTEQVVNQDRSAWLKTTANSAAEALLRTYAVAGNRDHFRQAVKFVSCQRLVRRLCDDCKQEITVSPKMIQQLGGNPKTQTTIFQQWRLPPPDQRVDEKGKPIEFPTCSTCRGLGFIGRIAVFELIEVNDAVNEALKKTPKVAAIDQSATQSKAKKSMNSAAYQLVLLGVTSLAEVQATLKK